MNKCYVEISLTKNFLSFELNCRFLYMWCLSSCLVILALYPQLCLTFANACMQIKQFPRWNVFRLSSLLISINYYCTNDMLMIASPHIYYYMYVYKNSTVGLSLRQLFAYFTPLSAKYWQPCSIYIRSLHQDFTRPSVEACLYTKVTRFYQCGP
jgi:hypothetical protein